VVAASGTPARSGRDARAGGSARSGPADRSGRTVSPGATASADEGGGTVVSIDCCPDPLGGAPIGSGTGDGSRSGLSETIGGSTP